MYKRKASLSVQLITLRLFNIQAKAMLSRVQYVSARGAVRNCLGEVKVTFLHLHAMMLKNRGSILIAPNEHATSYSANALQNVMLGNT